MAKNILSIQEYTQKMGKAQYDYVNKQLTNAIVKGDELLARETDSKYLYISKFDNAFYAADKKWKVTYKIYNATTDEMIREVDAAFLFNGKHQTPNNARISDNEYALIHFNFGGRFPGGYSYGNFILPFYFRQPPKEVSCRVYAIENVTHTIGWHDLAAPTDISISVNHQNLVFHNNVYAVSEIEFKIVGQNFENRGGTALTEIEFDMERKDNVSNPLVNSFVGKYEPERVYYSFTAPEFIEGGTKLSEKYAAKKDLDEISVNVYYQKSSSGTVAPAGLWTSYIPQTDPGEYLWSKTEIKYLNGKAVAVYGVSKNGNTGPSGTSDLPIGTVIAWAGKTGVAPENWHICDGSTFSQYDYPELYETLHSTTLPDMRYRYIKGANSLKSSDIGFTQDELLPEISGNFYGAAYDDDVPTGAFSTINKRNCTLSTSGGSRVHTYKFSANAYNNIYRATAGSSEQVRPKTTVLVYIIKMK